MLAAGVEVSPGPVAAQDTPDAPESPQAPLKVRKMRPCERLR